MDAFESDPGNCVFGLSLHPVVKYFGVFVGPEGGWDDSEIEAAQAADAILVTIGGRILRAETAAIALTAIVQNRFGDMN